MQLGKQINNCDEGGGNRNRIQETKILHVACKEEKGLFPKISSPSHNLTGMNVKYRHMSC